MKVLYLSCHSILEYDELKLLEELKIPYFSLGSYIDPQHPADPIRPALTQAKDEWAYAHAPDRLNLTKEFVDYFDVVIVMHVPEWIEANWSVLKGKKVVWRTIGQSTSGVERRMAPYREQGLKIVRYSPREKMIDNNCGADAVIRFYKDPDEFGGWIGAGNEVITFAQDMKHRAEFCHYDEFVKLAAGFNAHVYGPKNEASGELSGGFLTYEQMRQKMRDARVYIYTGTQPASYTLNFMEALMTGIPMVCIGPKTFNSLNIAGDVYEVQDIITSGLNGFISDDLEYLRGQIQFLLDNPTIAKRIGDMGRQTALDLFGKEKIKNLWLQFLNQL